MPRIVSEHRGSHVVYRNKRRGRLVSVPGNLATVADAPTVPDPPVLSGELDYSSPYTVVDGLLSWTVPDDDGGSPILGYRLYRVVGSNAPTLDSPIVDQ